MITRRQGLVACLCLAWIIPGLVGHDPWKPDEAHTFGIVYQLLKSGDWIVPHLAGEPFLAKPPLYYVSAAATARLLSPPFALHDAARIATGFYMALTFLFCGLAGRELFGRGSGSVTTLLLLGALGLVIRSHQLITDVAALTGFAMVFYGCALSARKLAGGFWLGIGTGMVFLSQGTFETGIALCIAALVPVAGAAWRTRTYAASAGVALLSAAPWFAIWPLLLYWHSPALFAAWLHQDLHARLFGGERDLGFYVDLIPWYAWPLWALALWTLWRARAQRALRPALILPLVGFVVILVALTFSADKRELHALPLLLPLALLATPAVATLRRGAANAWYWFSVMGFTFFIVVAWFYWTALELGIPARLHAHLDQLQPGYTSGMKWLPFLIGLAYTVAWIVVLLRLKRSPERPAVVWATGVAVVWSLVAVLFVGWLNTGKSYRSMVESLQAALPRHYRCMASEGLGEPQRAMLDYFAHIITRRIETTRGRTTCDLLLVQGRAGIEHRPPGGWRKIWEGNRPGDKVERYRLYQREVPSARKRR